MLALREPRLPRLPWQAVGVGSSFDERRGCPTFKPPLHSSPTKDQIIQSNCVCSPAAGDCTTTRSHTSDRSLPPRRHGPKHAVAPDQAMEKRGPEMREEGREEQIGEDSVEVAEPSIERQIMRQDRWQPQR